MIVSRMTRGRISAHVLSQTQGVRLMRMARLSLDRSDNVHDDMDDHHSQVVPPRKKKDRRQVETK